MTSGQAPRSLQALIRTPIDYIQPEGASEHIISKFSRSIWDEQACIIQAVFLDSDQKIQESHIRTVSKTKVLSSPTPLLQFRIANSSVHARVRRPDELATYILSSTPSRTPLITLWMASWCPSCRIISPLLNSLISSGVGEAEGVSPTVKSSSTPRKSWIQTLVCSI
jgi:thiol-disulfide isomerase/thioredoxin